MLRVTLDQMRSSAGRLAAAGIAILLGTAFVAASLLASATMRQATLTPSRPPTPTPTS